MTRTLGPGPPEPVWYLAGFWGMLSRWFSLKKYLGYEMAYKDLEKQRRYHAKYRAAHREKIAAASAKYRAAHPEAAAAIHAKYRAAHPEKIAAYYLRKREWVDNYLR